jgi:Icc-related predicted phosphoesterase
MNIAVFADIHGRILLAFVLCARWEKETGEKIDLILQAGDLGVFPDKAMLDKATLRHAESDPTELGFMHYFVGKSAEATNLLSRTACDLIFVRGNHEAHQWLDSLEQKARGPLFSIDVYQRLWCLKTGIPYTHTVGNEQITILGIGRIGQRGNTLKAEHIQPYEQQKLDRLGSVPIDILLTHDMPTGVSRRSEGMAEITMVLDRYRPPYHFFGHIGGDCEEGTSTNGTTHCCKLADLEWEGVGKVVHPGSMAILRWSDPQRHSLTVLDEPWLKEYTAYTWRYIA